VKSILCALTLAVALNAVAQETGRAAVQAVTIIRAGTLIDGKAEKPRHDQVIVIRGNRIESVSDAASAKTPEGATVIDLSQQTVLPGLIDSHTHIFLQGEDPAHGGYDANMLSAPLAFAGGPRHRGGAARAGAGLHYPAQCRNRGRWLRRRRHQGEIGVIAPGAFANIIATPGDPLKDIQALENVQFVMKNGVIFEGS